MKVLVVDDSIVFRTQISQALKSLPGIEVVGTAANGRIALQKIAQGTTVDLMTLDMEMPEMDGLETIKALRVSNKALKVIVFSSQNLRGAERALLALKEGADDIIAKPSGDDQNFDSALASIKASLVPKVLQFKRETTPSALADSPISNLRQDGSIPLASPNPTPIRDHSPLSAATAPPRPPHSYEQKAIESRDPRILVIASSTGGPTALETLFSQLPGPYKIPVLIAQHMPPVFTQILARRLGELSGVTAKEVQHGEALLPNTLYVAPGDYHFKVIRSNDTLFAETNQEPLRNSVRPAADYLFESAASLFGSQCLGLVLTGMGEDACLGAKAIKDQGGGILIQNKESCVVFGMPGAVYQIGAYDEIGDLDFIRKKLKMILTGP